MKKIPEPISIFYKLEASAGAEDDLIIYDVPSTREFILRKFIVAFESGTKGELEISAFRGIEKIIPKKGVFTGDNMSFEIGEEERFGPESELKIHYKNLNETVTKTAYILVVGEIR